MHRAIILAGGNIGDVAMRFEEAERLLVERGVAIVAKSQNYSTKAWGFESGSSFTNIAWVARTALSATEVLEALLAIEVEMGRDRKREYLDKALSRQSYADRMIDLDILLYGDKVVVTPHLQVPHPRLLEREFALLPMCDALGIGAEEGREMVVNIVKNEI